MNTTSSARFTERFSPAHLAEVLGTNTPTAEQQSVIRGGTLIDGEVHRGLDPMLVIAGAGSGKTQTMADRVVYLVANLAVRPDQILGVTFTRKAAAELKQRVTGQLGQLVRRGVVSVEEILSGRPDPEDLAEQRRRRWATDGLEDLLAPSVSTYHSYASSLVRSYGTHIGIEPEAVQLTEAHAWQLAHGLITTLHTGEDVPEHLHQLAARLAEAERSASALTDAVLNLTGELAEHLVTAEELQAWIADRLHGYHREYGEKPTTPKKLAEAVDGLLEKLSFRPVVAALAEEYQKIKRDKNFLDFGDLLLRAEEITRRSPAAVAAERDRYRVVLLDEFQDTSHAQLQLFHHLYGQGHSVTAVGDPNQSIYGFRGASAGQLFTFPTTFTTAEGNPAAQHVLTIAWRNAPTILSVANRLIDPFRYAPTSSEEDHTSPQNHRETTAHGGDPDHDDAEHHTPTEPPGAYLTRDWNRQMRLQLRRVTGELAAEDDAIASDGIRLRPNPYLTREDEPGRIALHWAGDAAEEARAIADELEAAYLRQNRAKGHRGDIRHPDPSVHPDKRVRAAVLARKRDQLLVLQQELRARNIPCELTGLAGLLSTPEIQEVCTYLTVLADPSRNDMVFKILAGPRFRLGARDLHRLGQFAAEQNRPSRDGEAEEQVTLLDAVLRTVHRHRARARGQQPRLPDVSEAALIRLEEFADLTEALDGVAAQGPVALIEHVMHTIGLTVELDVKYAGGSRAVQRLAEFTAWAESFESDHEERSLQAFLEWLEVAESQEGGFAIPEVEPNPDAVQLMTIHAAKGLEWTIVAVMGLQQDSLPNLGASAIKDRWTAKDGALPGPLRGDAASIPAWNDTGQGSWEGWVDAAEDYKENARTFTEEEERRLAYVAITRAEEELILTGTQFFSARKRPVGPSSYFYAAAEQLGRSSEVEQLVAQAQERVTSNAAAHTYFTAEWPFEPLDGPAVERTVYDDDGERVEGPVLITPHREPKPSQLVRQAAEYVTAQLGQENLPGLDELDEHTRFVLSTAQAKAASARLPDQITATHMVGFAEAPERLAQQLQRPIPQKPAVALRRGTAVHAWLEQHFDSIETTLPGFEDLGLDDSLVQKFQLEQVRSTFEQSDWANRRAFDVELPFALALAGTTVRGQIDAIFGVGDDGRELTVRDRKFWYGLPTAERNAHMQSARHWHLVDWKTGAVPADRDTLQHRLLQLAVYKHAFAETFGVDRENITVSFYYVEHGVTKTHPSEEMDGIDFPDSRQALEETLRANIRAAL
ncbi:ATP-dependent DNA helicase [Nesterenkonia alba]|uniref:ATP-dependent DNA helicase n=1 Tax=Nesterenkonia alba TaxID=515814 RepID=UPI0003B56404|nr:ATP-dependent DNA helicase [Nesterenkonia alba]